MRWGPTRRAHFGTKAYAIAVIVVGPADPRIAAGKAPVKETMVRLVEPMDDECVTLVWATGRRAHHRACVATAHLCYLRGPLPSREVCAVQRRSPTQATPPDPRRGPVAQLAEQQTLNLLVVGSIPTGLTSTTALPGTDVRAFAHVIARRNRTGSPSPLACVVACAACLT